MAVKPWMNAIILSRKRETGKATPVKVWRFTGIISGLIEKLNRFYPNSEKCAIKNMRVLEISKKFRPYLTKTYEQTIRNFYRIFVKNAQVFR